jgi:predicted dehydrogenase
MLPPLHPRREFIRLSGIAGIAFAGGAPFSTARGQSPGGKIRIGQIGTAHAHAGGKMDTMRKSDEFEVIGIVEPDPARRAAMETNKTYAGLRWMTEGELLGTPGLKAVAVETAVKDLVPTAARCIAAGKHVHLDKPAGESLPAFKRLLDDATARQLTVQMGYMLRYNPAFALCFRLVRDGALGEVFSVEAAMSKALGAAERKALMPYRGGAMFELGCHVIDAVITVMGRPAKVTAYSRSSSALNDGFADNQLAVLEYPKALVTVRSALVEIDGGARRQFAVCGTKGTLDIRPIEPPEARLTLDAPRGEYKKGWQTLTFPKGRGRYDGDFADFAKVIRGERALAFSPGHDLAVQETVLLASGLPVG